MPRTTGQLSSPALSPKTCLGVDRSRSACENQRPWCSATCSTASGISTSRPELTVGAGRLEGCACYCKIDVSFGSRSRRRSADAKHEVCIMDKRDSDREGGIYYKSQGRRTTEVPNAQLPTAASEKRVSSSFSLQATKNASTSA